MFFFLAGWGVTLYIAICVGHFILTRKWTVTKEEKHFCFDLIAAGEGVESLNKGSCSWEAFWEQLSGPLNPKEERKLFLIRVCQFMYLKTEKLPLAVFVFFSCSSTWPTLQRASSWSTSSGEKYVSWRLLGSFTLLCFTLAAWITHRFFPCKTCDSITHHDRIHDSCTLWDSTHNAHLNSIRERREKVCST